MVLHLLYHAVGCLFLPTALLAIHDHFHHDSHYEVETISEQVALSRPASNPVAPSMILQARLDLNLRQTIDIYQNFSSPYL